MKPVCSIRKKTQENDNFKMLKWGKFLLQFLGVYVQFSCCMRILLMEESCTLYGEYPIFNRGSAPSQVFVWDFLTINSISPANSNTLQGTITYTLPASTFESMMVPNFPWEVGYVSSFPGGEWLMTSPIKFFFLWFF